MARRPVVFLGVGHPHAAGRAHRLKNVPSLEMKGAFDDDPRLARDFVSQNGGSAFATVQEALERASSGLTIIETRNRRAAELATLAVDRSVAVLLDKPGAHDVDTLRRLKADAERKRAFVHVGYHMRYSPSVVRGLEIVKSGALGRITTGRFHAAVQSPWLTNEWFCDPDDMGGLVFLDACHVLDILTLCLGRPRSISCRMKKLVGVPAHPFEDSAAMILDYGDALVAGDVCGWETNDWVETWNVELYGDLGTLILGLHPPRLKLWSREARGDFACGWSEISHASFDGELNYEYELTDVADRLDRGALPGGATLEEALSLLELSAQCYQDARAHGYSGGSEERR